MNCKPRKILNWKHKQTNSCDNLNVLLLLLNRMTGNYIRYLTI